MQGNRGKDTGPELRLRRELHALGIRYRVDVKVEEDLRTRADLALKSVKLAVFVDGCFWHGCPEHGGAPKRNATYWNGKITRNIERDKETDATLRARGWTVLRFWEHQDAEAAATSVCQTIVELKRPQLP
jgi:DNA mismatch endonuclease (patch repair protein)